MRERNFEDLSRVVDESRRRFLKNGVVGSALAVPTFASIRPSQFAPTIEPTALSHAPARAIETSTPSLVADCKLISDANITAGANVLSSASAGFTAADVGTLVGIVGAGTPDSPYSGTITGFTDSNHVTVSANAANTVTNGFAGYGTDNLPALNASVTGLGSAGGAVLLPTGAFAVSNTWVIPSNVNVQGAGSSQTALYLIGSIKSTGGPFAVIEFATAAGGAPSAGLVDRVSCKALRVGIVPAEARSFNGNGIAMIATNFLVDDVEVYVPGSTYSVMSAGILVYNNNPSGSPAGPGTVRNCRTYNTITSGSFTANCSGVTIEGNYINNSGDDAIGMASGNGGTTPQQQTTIVGNTVRNCGGRGIVCTGGVRLTITANNIVNTFSSGIAIQTSTGYLLATEGIICANVIDGAGVMPQPTYNVQTGAPGAPVGSPNGIHLDGASSSLQVTEIAISGNSIVNTRCCPIAVVGGGSTVGVVAVTITGNSIVGAVGQSLTRGQSVSNGLTDIAHCPGIYCHLADAVSNHREQDRERQPRRHLLRFELRR